MPRFPLPEKFEEGDFSSFKKSFVRVSKANGWDSEEQLAALPLALVGRALLAFEAAEADFETVEDAFRHLEAEFDTALDKEAAMKAFHSSRWGEGLDPAVFGERLKLLLRRGLPSLSPADVERIVVGQFVAGFPASHREKLALIFAGKTPQLAEAVAAARDLVREPSEGHQACALRMESPTQEQRLTDDPRLEKLTNRMEELAVHVAALTARENNGRDRRRRQPAVKWRTDAGGRGNRASSIRCYNCSGYGHIAKFCPSPIVGRAGNDTLGDRSPTANPRAGANWSA